MSIVGNGDAAGLRNSFEARRNICAIAKDIVVVYYNIVDMKADAKADPIVPGRICILLSRAAL